MWFLEISRIDVLILSSSDTGFMICMYFFETYLDLRQHKILALPTLPATLKGVVSDEKFGKARAYSLDKRYCVYFERLNPGVCGFSLEQIQFSTCFIPGLYIYED